MADLDGLKVAKDYHVDTPFANNQGFYVKGANNLDWGMQKHLSNIFDPKSGNTVMFAFDHGYFMGSTAGLERLDLLLMLTASWALVAQSGPAYLQRFLRASLFAFLLALLCFSPTSRTRLLLLTSRTPSA